MGREVRRVPKGWEHPRVAGRYKPLYDFSFQEAAAQWKSDYEAWKTDPKDDCEMWEWYGDPPDPEYYRPNWDESERTHYMMYENVTEGTPISPAFETLEDLARWLTNTEASSFADETTNYETWLNLCKGSLK